jgi:hypothetical protein
MISSHYPRAVGKQPPSNQLGWSFLDWFSGYETPTPLRRTPPMDNFWNAGVNMAYGRDTAYQPAPAPRAIVRRSGGDTDLKPRGRQPNGYFSLWGHPAVVGVEAFNRAKTQMDYGNVGAAKAELGDLFNDIMGAVVPGWDSRPDALKNIVVKPDPNKIVAMAQKIAPNAAQDIVRTANANGMQVYVNTPAGQVGITPENAQLYYGNYQFLTKAQGMLGSIGSMPQWIWYAAGAGILAFVMLKR